MKFRFGFLISIFLFLSPILIGQTYSFNTRLYSIKDGLKNRKVYSIAKDQDELFWVVTHAGINIFDGHVFLSTDHLPNQLQTDHYNEVACSRDGYLWFFQDPLKSNNNMSLIYVRHIVVYDKATNQLVNPLTDIVDQKIYGIQSMPDGGLLIWTDKGELYTYTDRLEKYANVNSPERIIRIEKSADRMFILYNDKIAEYNRRVTKEEWVTNFFPGHSFLDPDGNLWLAHKNIKFDQFPNPLSEIGMLNSQGIIDRIPRLFTNNISRAYRSSLIAGYKDKLLINYKSDVIVYDPQKKQILERKKIYDQIKNGVVHSIYKINDNNFWLCTAQGLVLLNIEDISIKNFFTRKSYSTRGIIPISDDSLLVATYSGLRLVNPLNGHFISISEKGPYVLDMVELSKDLVIGGLAGEKYVLIDKNSLDYHFVDELDGREHAQRTNPVKLENGEVWLRTFPGVYKYDTKKDQFEIPDIIRNSEIAQLNVNNISYFDNTYHFSTEKGIYVSDLHSKVNFLKNTDWYNVSQALNDDEAYWISTYGKGLIRMDKSSGEIRKFDMKTSGFPNDFVYSVHDDGLGYLWLPTNYGLIRMDKNTFSIQVFLPANGFVNHEYNHSSFYEDKNGHYYFGGINGLTKLDPNEFVNTSRSIELKSIKGHYIESDGEEKELLAIKDGQIELPFDYRSLELFFLTSEISDASITSIRYLIIDYTDEWIPLDNNKLKINRLPTGNYTMKIRAVGNGHLSSTIHTLNLKVLPAFHQTRQFALVVIVGLGCIAYLMHRTRISRLNNRNKMLEKQVSLRTTELQNNNEELKSINHTRDRLFGIIAHDLRGPLLGFKDLGKKIKFLSKKNRLDEIDDVSVAINENYSSIIRLLDNLLNWISIQRGSLPIKLMKLNLSKHIEQSMKLYNQSIQDKSLNPIVEISDTYAWADPDAINIVLRNILNNAIKYSHQSGNIKIRCWEEGQYACLAVRDFGLGMSREELDQLFKIKPMRGKQGTDGERSTGIGLPLTRELIELMNGQIQVESELGEGSCFKVYLPAYNLAEGSKSL